jgi:hypothetical protein
MRIMIMRSNIGPFGSLIVDFSFNEILPIPVVVSHTLADLDNRRFEQAILYR